MRPECSDASGRPSHYVYTGVTLIAGNKKKLCSGNQGGRIPMSEKEIESYIACKESDDKASIWNTGQVCRIYQRH